MKISHNLTIAFLASFLFFGCESGDSSSDPTPESIEAQTGFVVETIPEPKPIPEKSMDAEAASKLSMYILRLLSWHETVFEDTSYRSHHFDFVPSSYWWGDFTDRNSPCMRFGKEDRYWATINEQQFLESKYSNCIHWENPGTKWYFHGKASYQFRTEGDLSPSLHVIYDQLRTQMDPEQELQQYSNQRAELFDGEFRMWADGDTRLTSANLTVESNIVGRVVFSDVMIQLTPEGEVISAIGSVGVSEGGTFPLSSQDGLLVIGKASEAHTKLQIDTNCCSKISFSNGDQRAGNWVWSVGIDDYDRRKTEPPFERAPPDAYRVGNQIDLSSAYTSYNESLLSYSLELEHIKVRGTRSGKTATSRSQFHPSELPEALRPIIHIDETSPGILNLSVEKLGWDSASLYFRPVVRDHYGSTAEVSGFYVDLTGDYDGDGILNRDDDDTDNDGVTNANDDLPYDPTSSTDTDEDGIGNEYDDDDDNDGVTDELDFAPLNWVCHEQYSTLNGECYGTSNGVTPQFEIEGITNNGIALLRNSIYGGPLVFRFDIENNVFLPPIELGPTDSESSGMTWDISIDTNSDDFFALSGAGKLYRISNTASAVITSIYDVGPIQLGRSQFANTVQGNVYFIGRQDKDTGVTSAYLLSPEGELLDSVSADSDYYLQNCEKNLAQFYSGCVYVEDGSLVSVTADDDTNLFLENFTLSPDKNYAASGYEVYQLQNSTLLGDIDELEVSSHQVALGWINNDVVVKSSRKLRLWNVDQKSYTKEAIQPETIVPAETTVLVGNKVYAVSYNLESRQLNWREIEFEQTEP